MARSTKKRSRSSKQTVPSQTEQQQLHDLTRVRVKQEIDDGQVGTAIKQEIIDDHYGEGSSANSIGSPAPSSQEIHHTGSDKEIKKEEDLGCPIDHKTRQEFLDCETCKAEDKTRVLPAKLKSEWSKCDYDKDCGCLECLRAKSAAVASTTAAATTKATKRPRIDPIDVDNLRESIAKPNKQPLATTSSFGIIKSKPISSKPVSSKGRKRPLPIEEQTTEQTVDSIDQSMDEVERTEPCSTLCKPSTSRQASVQGEKSNKKQTLLAKPLIPGRSKKAQRPKPRREPKRAVIDLQQKKVYIDLMNAVFKKDKDASLRKLATEMKIKAQTLYGIWRNRKTILERLAKNPDCTTTTVTDRLHPITKLMETRLVIWYQFQIQNGVTPVMPDLCKMAFQIATDLCELYCDQQDKFTFKASPGWFTNFCQRHKLHIPVSENQARKLNANDKQLNGEEQ